MKRTIILSALLYVSQAFWATPMQNHVFTNETYVYICTGSSSKCYHKTSSCRGLGNCGGNIVKITESSAIDKGRRKCKICY